MNAPDLAGFQRKVETALKGDLPGHAFHGNQWRGGESAEKPSEHSAAANYHAGRAGGEGLSPATVDAHMNAAEAHNRAAALQRDAAGTGRGGRGVWHDNAQRATQATNRASAKANRLEKQDGVR